ncbi:hypothetical protein BJ322DRAFT_1014701 [Thelephora terrestris]|uniref:Uncharacterized protein n=1 Tax=Thelephora terrestris TaxID=56493 RepID=A0A9P6H348_9AGAM|nr:hypothetical protein BJ322DRAFT_1014701 [Thelephora terrestris]
MQIRVDGKSRTVTRTQFPITGADSFTDYRAQGQTIPYVIIDIAPPPTSGLSLFNLYVHEPKLTDEDERLERMDVATTEWWDKMRVE